MRKKMKDVPIFPECAQTLDKGDINGDGKLTVLDIDYILH